MFAIGGFLFILGRVMIAAICSLLVVITVQRAIEIGSEAFAIGAFFATAILAVGGWSIFVVVRAVRRDAFGNAGEGAARVRYTGRHS